MSRLQQPLSPKQQVIQTMLLVTVIFLGYQMFFGSKNTAPPAGLQTSEEVLAKMREANANLRDVSIVSGSQGLKPLLDKAVNTELEAKKISKEEAEYKRMLGTVLVADTQLKAGLARKESSRIRAAYMTLDAASRKLEGEKIWESEKFEVSPAAAAPERFQWSTWTPQALYDKAVAELSTFNRNELVWGFMPGGYQFIDFLVNITGRVPSFSYWFAALLLALVVRAIIFPLAQKQLMWSRQMSQLQPLVKDLREKYKDDPQQQQVKMMELYREYGINPFGGCAPALVQMPLFLFVYQCMLHYQFTFEQGTFLWINPATSAATNGFIAPNLGKIDMILIGIYGVSMLISTLLAPISDPSQAKQQRLIGIMFAIGVPVFMLLGLFPVPAAFVLYWTFTNIFATLQSLRAYRLPLPPLVKVNTKNGGAVPLGPFGNMGMPNGKGSNGQSNGKISEPVKTGVPVKHKPKKRK